jgi:hypothetical protein
MMPLRLLQQRTRPPNSLHYSRRLTVSLSHSFGRPGSARPVTEVSPVGVGMATRLTALADADMPHQSAPKRRPPNVSPFMSHVRPLATNCRSPPVPYGQGCLRHSETEWTGRTHPPTGWAG